MKIVLFALLWMSAAAPLNAAPTQATANVVVKASVLKPVTLEWVQNLNLGNITVTGGTWTGQVVSISRTGAKTCGAKLICTGVTQVAKYRVSGANKETVAISAPTVRLINQSDPSKSLALVVDSPGSVVLTNSGNQGQEFALGGAITLDSSTAEGIYTGTFNVTVEYR